MAGRRQAPLWQRRFLRALGRTGNVEASAEAAGVDKSTAYARRKAHADFMAKWDAAAARGKVAAKKWPLHHAPHGPPPRGKLGEELILRASKNGAQLVKAGPGRWSGAIEEAFLDHYAQSGCIRRAAREAGVSANIIHYRKKHYPGFAADCGAAEARATERLRGLVTAAGVASFDPDYAEEGLPKVSVAEAIAILRLKGPGSKPERKRPLPSIEEVRANILRKLDAIEAHEKGE